MADLDRELRLLLDKQALGELLIRIDRFERRNGEWRFASRRVAMEWMSEEIEASDAFPGGYRLENFAPTRYDRSDPSYERNWQ